MVQVVVKESGFLKAGNPIGNATFAQRTTDDNKKEKDIPLIARRGKYDGTYYVDALYAFGTIAVSATGYKSNTFRYNTADERAYEVWLSK